MAVLAQLQYRSLTDGLKDWAKLCQQLLTGSLYCFIYPFQGPIGHGLKSLFEPKDLTNL